MRILHTADWHLGLELDGHSRLAEQKLFLSWLLETCVQESVDAVLVAGDVYDTFNPPVEAQAMLAQFLVDLKKRIEHITVVCIAGNHDSASRLELPTPYAQALSRLHLVGTLPQEPSVAYSKMVLPLYNSKGSLGACCFALPFLRPMDLVVKANEEESAAEAYGRTLGQYVQDMRQQAVFQYPDTPMVFVGHLSLALGQSSQSERPLIGGLEGVPREAIVAGFEYVALGHLHKAQKLGGEHVRYSGSPISMDMDERTYTHQVLVVDMPTTISNLQIKSIPVPKFVPLWRMPEKAGDWADLETSLASIAWENFRALPDSLQPFLQPHLGAQAARGDQAKRMEDLSAKYPVRLVAPKRETIDLSSEKSEQSPHRFMDLRSPQMPLFLLRKAWKRKHGDAELPQELQDLFVDIENQIRSGEKA